MVSTAWKSQGFWAILLIMVKIMAYFYKIVPLL